MITTTICDGKYTVENNNGTLTFYRNGELCGEYVGDGFVLSLFQELEVAHENINNLLAAHERFKKSWEETKALPIEDFDVSKKMKRI